MKKHLNYDIKNSWFIEDYRSAPNKYIITLKDIIEENIS